MAKRIITVEYSVKMTQVVEWYDDETALTHENLSCNLDPENSNFDLGDWEIETVKSSTGEEINLLPNGSEVE